MVIGGERRSDKAQIIMFECLEFLRRHSKSFCVVNFRVFCWRLMWVERPSCCSQNKYQPQVSTSNINLKYQPQVSTSSINLKYQPQVSTSSINLKYQPQVSTSSINLKYQPQVSTSSINFKYQPQKPTSTINFK